MRCDRPEPPAAEGLTIGALTDFSLQQEAALNVCQEKLTRVGGLVRNDKAM